MSHPEATTLAALVDGQLSEDERHAIEAHLAQCVPCRELHAQLRTAAAALQHLSAPLVAGSSSLVSDALFRRELPRARWVRPLASACALLLAVAGSFVWSQRSQPAELPLSHSADWVPRGGGGAEGPLRLEVFEEDASRRKRVLHSGSAVRADARLGFNVEKRLDAQRHLAVFALDSAGVVHWFYPAHLSSETDPQAIPLPAGRARFELPELVQPEAPEAGTMLIVALSAPEPFGVRAVEALLASGGVQHLIALGPVETATLTVSVEP